MPTFSEQLKAIRKERNITQEKLSKEMGVSRQTISHWENGRVIPDIDTIKHLSQVMNYNFFAVEGVEAETQTMPEAEGIPARTEENTAQETAVQQTNASPHKNRFVWPAVLGAVLLCAVVLVCLLMNGKPLSNQAQVKITTAENPVRAIRFEEFPESAGWFYEFRIEETAGVPFTVLEIISTNILDNGKEYSNTFTAEQVAEWWGSNVLEQHIPQTVGGGFPLLAIKGVRLTINGKDANENELTFEGYVELSKEIAE